MDPKPFHIVYVRSSVQRRLHRVDAPTLILLVKGYDTFRLIGPSGDEYFAYDGHTPTLLLAAPGMKIDFSSNRGRENGYIEFIADMVRLAESVSVAIREQEHWIEVPCHLPLRVDDVSLFRDQFEDISRLWSSPVPRNLFRVKAGIISLLSYFIEQGGPEVREAPSPAQELRRRMDADQSFSNNLSELSRQCGYSEDHLRKLFRERYGVSPMKYRQRQRLRHAMDLLQSTDLPLPEIAVRIGFRHFSHFSTAFGKAYGMTPSQRRRGAGA